MSVELEHGTNFRAGKNELVLTLLGLDLQYLQALIVWLFLQREMHVLGGFL